MEPNQESTQPNSTPPQPDNQQLPPNNVTVPTTSKPSSRHFLFFVILLLILSTIMVGFLFLQNQSLKSQLGLSTIKFPWIKGACIFNGKGYQPGEHVPVDSCNTCGCNDDGSIICTQVVCSDEVEVSQVDPTEDWQEFSDGQYSFKYPSGVDISKEASNERVVRAVYMGPTQKYSGRTQTELFDGYMFIVTEVDSSNYTSQQDQAKKVLEQERTAAKDICDKEIENSPIIQVQIGNVTAEQFSYEGCFGNPIHSFVEHNNNLYQITQVYYGDDQNIANYANISNQILSTFQFNDQQSQSLNTITMQGKLVSVERPDPDINYDFQLLLDTPYFDELNAKGPRNISTIIVVPENETIRQKLIENIENPVSIEGRIEWGLAETRHLKAEKITSLIE
jgi:hypothetical protein